MIGKTGNGKSTLINKIIGKELFEVNSLLPLGNHAQHTSTTLHISDQKVYQCNVIEAGLPFTQFSTDYDSLAKQLRYVKEVVGGKLNLIILVLRFGRLTSEEVSAFKMYMNSLGECKCISACVITHCELYSMNQRTQYLEEFRHDNVDIAASMDKGIYTVGFPNLTALDADNNFVEFLERKMHKDVSELHQLVDKSDVTVDVSGWDDETALLGKIVPPMSCIIL